jgi:hypothetical protein
MIYPDSYLPVVRGQPVSVFVEPDRVGCRARVLWATHWFVLLRPVTREKFNQMTREI